MAIDVSGFNVPENNWEGLQRAGNIIASQRKEDQEIATQRSARTTATSKFLTDYLDPKDHLTGTPYDPQIVGGLQSILQQGEALASKGADTNSILMALGPQVTKITDYQTRAKLIRDQTRASIARLKPYAGYNTDALEEQATKAAFYDQDGKLKDVSKMDPNTDWVSEVLKNTPELVTTGKGVDDFVNKTPQADYSRNVTTAYGGRSRDVKYEAKHGFWEDLQKDDKGNIAVDSAGNPIGLGVIGSSMVDDNNKPIINQDTGKPYQVIDKQIGNAITSHNSDINDFLRGQVRMAFKQAGAKEMPAEGSPQWDMMKRHVLHDELETRSRSYFRTIDKQKESAPAVKVELGGDPNSLDALAKYESALKLKGDYSIYDPKAGKAVKTNAVEAVGKVFNNDPAFLQGESEDLPDGRSVINVTSAFPGGGLKTGRGADDVYKSIFYDPNKRSLIVETEPKAKDASGKKTRSFEEIPESKAGIFMARIAGSNGVDPDKVSEILTGQGYKGAKFNNVVNPVQTTDRLQEEHATKVTAAVKNVEENNFDALKGLPTKDGVIQKVNDRYIMGNTFGGRYEIDVKGPDGKTNTLKFKDKDEFKKYIQGPVNTETEDLRKKYKY